MSEKTLDERLEDILKQFYFHATGIEDYGCKECVQALSDIKRAVREEMLSDIEIDNILNLHFGRLINKMPRKLCAKAIRQELLRRLGIDE